MDLVSCCHLSLFKTEWLTFPDAQKTLECCDVLFPSKSHLKEHKKLFHADGYRCKVCSRPFCRWVTIVFGSVYVYLTLNPFSVAHFLNATWTCIQVKKSTAVMFVSMQPVIKAIWKDTVWDFMVRTFHSNPEKWSLRHGLPHRSKTKRIREKTVQDRKSVSISRGNRFPNRVSVHNFIVVPIVMHNSTHRSNMRITRTLVPVHKKVGKWMSQLLWLL